VKSKNTNYSSTFSQKKNKYLRVIYYDSSLKKAKNILCDVKEVDTKKRKTQNRKKENET